jgi:Transposase DDE domain
MIMKLRQQLVEHPFGTIKFWNDQRHFLMKGLEKVKGEFSLSTLAYNIKRAINVLGVRALVAALA